MFKKKKKNKKADREIFKSLTANGVEVPVMDLQITKDDEGEPIIKLICREAIEALHFDEIDFVMKTDKKCLKLGGAFRDAYPIKKFKVYVFDLTNYEQYFE
ncbi:MAG: hypothetical protein K6C36_03815 [Clostridia bacterium]|nr:hypothetical protein [Clostridia bacterium]